MVSQARANRIANRIREELSELLLYEITDPRLQGVSITKVFVDRELAFATIFVSSLEGASQKETILDGFNHASGFIRRSLARSIDLRAFPQLRFNWDPSLEHADRIDHLIASIHDESPDDGEEDSKNE
jgi:ribosome-binding factor A